MERWLTMTHTLTAVSTPLSLVISQVIFPFISIFPMMSHCVSFYYSLSFWLSSDLSCWFYGRTFWKIPKTHLMSNCLQISEMLLSCSGFPMYIRGCLASEKEIKFRFILSSAFFNKVLNSTVLITGFVSNSHQGLNQFDYINQSVFILLHQA